MINLLTGIFLALESVEDLKSKEVTLLNIILFGILGVFFRLKECSSFIDIMAACSVGLFTIALSYLFNEAIGYGDGAVLLILGIWLDFFRVLRILFISLWVMFAVAICKCIGRRLSRKDTIAFVPCIFVSFILECGLWLS